MAEEVQPIQADGVTDGADLIDEDVHHPQSDVVRMVRLAAAQLVVENDRAPRLSQDPQILQIVVREAGTAMKDEQGQLRPDADRSPSTWYHPR